MSYPKYRNRKWYARKRSIDIRRGQLIHYYLRTLFMDLLKDEPCMDCRKRFPPECMDWDHVRGKKLLKLGESVRYQRVKLEKELAKCDLVCANCHRTRTRKRRKTKWRI